LAFVLEPVTSATREIILPRPERFTVGRATVTPNTVITFSGMPNASAFVAGEGELEVHIGVLFAFLSLKLSVRTVRGPDAAPYVMEVNLNMAFFFTVLTLFEVWQLLRGAPGDFRTHPPVGVRKALFHHVQAKKEGMSQEDFLFRHFGAGTVVNHVMARTIDAYVALRNRG
jgi:hypothetical protein